MSLALVSQSDGFVLINVFTILIIMSIVTWSIIVLRAIRLRKAKDGSVVVKELVLASFTLNEVVQKARSVDSPMGRLTEEAAKVRQNYRRGDAKLLANALPLNEYLIIQARNSMSQIMCQSDGGMTSLASIGVTTPFTDLFDAVWGIYHALINISQSGQMSTAAMAGLIGETLASTAAGLFAVIPAALAYNFLNRNTRVLSQDVDAYARDLHVRLLNQEDQAMVFGSMNSGDNASVSEINIMPLVDVMLVSLIVFMITIPVLTHSIPLKLSTVSKQAVKKEKQPTNPLWLAIGVDGSYYFGTESVPKVSIEGAAEKLETVKTEKEGLAVAIAASGSVKYDYINKAPETACKAGVSKMGFITKTRSVVE